MGTAVSAEALLKERNDSAKESRIATDSIRDIGPPPSIVDQDRRDRGKNDLRFFLDTYFPRVFSLKWSADHKYLLKKTQDVMIDGGKVCVAMPRGSGKTSIFQHAMVWGTLHGHQIFPILLSADAGNFARLLNGIKTVMETNRLLMEDFPEIIHPIRALNRTPTRAPSQICCGASTYIKWGTNAIQFPTTEWSTEQGNAGACIGGGGLTSSAIRGQVMSLPNGDQVRPSVALVDDPATRKVARSEIQCSELEDTIKADICGMAGPDSELALMMSCTVIFVGDLADRIMDKNRNPQIHSVRIATIKTWPTNMTKWEEYSEIRRQEMVEELPAKSANKFYRKHRKVLDEGCLHYWPQRKPPGYVSAIEASMAEYFVDPRSFMSERQNQPSEEYDDEFVPLNPLELARRISIFPQHEVPPDAERITAFVDVQQRMLFYTVVAWTKSYGGYVIDYGVWPKARRRHFVYATVKSPTLQTYYKASDDDAIRMGIVDLLSTLRDTVWERLGDGAQMRLSRGLIDCGYKYDVVEASIIHGALGNDWVPARGVGLGAKDTPLKLQKEFKRQDGNHWTHSKPRDRFLRCIHVDTNYWKSHVYDSLRVPASHSAAILWYKETQSHHQMISDHSCAEVAKKVESEKKGMKIDEWTLKPSRPDNHLYDCLVGCAVGAAIDGLRREAEVVIPVKTVKRRRRNIKL